MHDLEPMRGISSKLVTPPPVRSVGEAEQLERGLRRRHADERGLDRARARHQPQHRRGDDAERALGADEQVPQVVAGIVLLELVEVVQHAAVGEHHFEAEHMRARDAVGERRGAAGIGREIAADGAAAFRRQQMRKEPVDGGGGLARRCKVTPASQVMVFEVGSTSRMRSSRLSDSTISPCMRRLAADQSGIAALRHDRACRSRWRA